MSPQPQHGCATACRAAQRRFGNDAPTSAPPRLLVDRSAAENQTFRTLDLRAAPRPGFISQLDSFSLWPVAEAHAHGTSAPWEWSDTSSAVWRKNPFHKSQAAKTETGNVTNGFITWHPEEFKFWGRFVLARQQEGFNILLKLQKYKKMMISLLLWSFGYCLFEQISVAWRPQEPDSFYVGTNQTWDDNNTKGKLSHRAACGVPPQAAEPLPNFQL